MIPFLITAAVAFLFYLLLTIGSGDMLLWSAEELIAGVIIGIIAGIAGHRILCRSGSFRMVHPARLIMLGIYIIGPFLIELTKANFDVAYRVITGNIRPGIMRVKTGLKTDFGQLMLANSITLTPGTLTVDLDEKTGDLFIHIINIDEETRKKSELSAKELFTFVDLPAWVRRIAE